MKSLRQRKVCLMVAIQMTVGLERKKLIKNQSKHLLLPQILWSKINQKLRLPKNNRNLKKDYSVHLKNKIQVLGLPSQLQSKITSPNQCLLNKTSLKKDFLAALMMNRTTHLRKRRKKGQNQLNPKQPAFRVNL